MSTTVNFPSGLALELVLKQPSVPIGISGNKLAVLLHPWSWLGGNMNDPVLCYFLRPLQSRGFHVVLYNSRGVGCSSGWASLTGLQEAKDLQEIVQWGLVTVSNVRHVLLLGYSHGSLIASQHPPLPSIKTSHILLSYPLGPRAFLTFFRTRTYDRSLASLAQEPRADVLVLFGDRDEFTGVDNYERWARQLRLEGGGEGGRVSVVCVKGATHFWERSKAEEMLRVVEQWLERN